MSARVVSVDDFRAWAATGAAGLAFAGPDPHHGIGLDLLVPGYRVAAVDAPPALALLRRRGVGTFALDEALGAPGGVSRSTQELLARPETAAFLDGDGGRPTRLLVFKTSATIASICRTRGWSLLAAPAPLARRWENKVAFRSLAEALGLPQAPGLVADLAEASFEDLAGRLGSRALVVQAPHGYSGARTARVTDAAGLAALKAAWRAGPVRVTAFLAGLPLTLNACVTARGVAVSAPFVQVTGHPALTPHALGSCGNDWSAAAGLGLDPAPFTAAARRLGEALAGGGYRGIFGVDFLLGEDGRAYVIEVNPRLVASVAMYTQLELAAGRLPLLARHVLAFLAPDLDAAPLDLHLAPVQGAQVILHNLGNQAARVTGAPRTGVLASGGAAGTVARETAHVGELAAGEWLALAPGRGRVVGAGQELGRLQSRAALASARGEPLAAVLGAVAALLAAARLEAEGTAGGDGGELGTIA